MQTIKYLLSLAIIREEANGMLFNTLVHGPRDFRSLEIQQILMDAGIKRNQRLQTNENDEKVLSSTPSNSTFVRKIAHELMTSLRRGLRQCTQYNKGDHWLEETRGMLMVVATMISTMTFQAAMNPPGGVWQENNTSSIIGEDIYCSQDRLCYAGTAVLAYVWTYDMLQFMNYNTISFFFSLCVTIFLISGFPLTNRTCVWLLSMAMCVTITFAGLAYLQGIYLVMPYDIADHVQEKYRPIGLDIWKALLLMVGTFHTIRFLAWLGKKVKSVYRYKRPNMSIEDGRTDVP